MNNRLLTIAIFVVAVSILINSFITAKNTATLAIKPQMQEILRRQEAMEQKLSSLESNISSLTQGFKDGLGGLFAKKMPSPLVEDFDKEYKIDIGHSSIKGNKNAKVTITEFSDFQCPFSGRFHPVISEVLKAYPKDVNFVFKNFPLSFHQQARSAAKASLAAGEQGKYWEMVELLFQNNRELNEEKYKQLAGELGLNVEQFIKDYKEKDVEWERVIQEDMTVGRNVNVLGTPTFYINGKKTNARDLESFKAEIDSILKGETKK